MRSWPANEAARSEPAGARDALKRSSKTPSIVLVGLGTIAAAHLRALEWVGDVPLLAGVDIDPPPCLLFHGREVPLYSGLRDAAAKHDPDIVVISTPTPTHAAVCKQAAEMFPDAEILVEKPAADNLADASFLLRGMGGGRLVNVAYHMACSLEVRWAERLIRRMSETLGAPTEVTALFSDPYEHCAGSARARFGNSWIDSGINALSVLSRFVEPVACRSLQRLGETDRSAYEGRIRCLWNDREIEALIVTTWHVTASARSTRIGFTCGAELVMDHHRVSGYLIQDGMMREIFGSDGRVPRRESHYRALYHAYLVGGRQIVSPELSRRLHDLLLEPLDRLA